MEEDALKTTFITYCDHYEFLVIHFCVINALIVFIDLMNCVFMLYLYQFIIILIDDILVYSKIKDDNATHLRLMKIWR